MAGAIGATIAVVLLIGMVVTPIALIVLLCVWLVRRGSRSSADGAAKLTAAARPHVTPGWYPDPAANGATRWWDGTRWGEVQTTQLQSRPSPREIQRAAPSAVAGRSRPRSPRRVASRVRAEWIPPGEPVEVSGYLLREGLVYVGHGLAASDGSPEPALIDPTLKLARARPDVYGQSLSYWPSYSTISPAARAAYLGWLAAGRRAGRVPIGYVFLFFYGLERRVVVDQTRDAVELSHIRAEVVALRAIYAATSGSFDGYSAGFLELVDLLLEGAQDATRRTVPSTIAERWPIPPALRLQLGQYAATRQPVPAEWAFAWSWYSPELRLRTPATRCGEEYRDLFERRYRQAFGSGLIVAPTQRRIALTYRAASSGIRIARPTLDLTDVLDSRIAVTRLGEISEGAQDALDSYSRYLGKNPQARGTLGALALLPAEILPVAHAALNGLLQWARVGTARTSAPAADLLAQWGLQDRDRLTKAETLPIVQLLGKLGIGVEPDIRFGGPPLSRTADIVLFEHPSAESSTSSAEYTVAQSLIHLAVAVSSADDRIADEEREALMDHIERSLDLTSDERRRLHAHAQWLAIDTVALGGLAKRVATLDALQRERLTDLLVRVAVSDGIVTPEEMRALTKIFAALGHEEIDVARRVHAALTGEVGDRAQDESPMVVQNATPAGFGESVPAPTRRAARERTTRPAAVDREVIRQKIAETEAVSALLSDVFRDDEDDAADRESNGSPAEKSIDAADDVLVAGFDTGHSGLFLALAGRTHVSREEFESLAAAVGVMPHGALDVLNEAAFDQVGEPLLEGDTDLVVHTDVWEELSK
jgi:uncharacterized tellurite resistance protein B-like protein